MVELIPKKLINDFIPFEKEAINQWKENVDVLHFLSDLYDFDGVMISPDGKRIEVNYRDYGENVFDENKKEIVQFLDVLKENALKSTPTLASTIGDITIIDFHRDPDFGLTAKYIIAFDGIYRQILEEGAYSSTSHILEVKTDLECSLLLASHLYFKQSYQVMRSMLENLILPILFGLDTTTFEEWRKNDFRTPRLRGKTGILKKFIENGLLDEKEATTIADLYGELSESIHGSEKRLIHAGLHVGRWTGHIFTTDEFHHWTNNMSRQLETAIILLRIQIEQWKQYYKDKGVLCDVCLRADFDIEEDRFGWETYLTYKCKHCGREMTYKKPE